MSNEVKSVVVLNDVRLAFPHLIEPQTEYKGKVLSHPTYSADFLMDPIHPGYQQFENVLKLLAADKWKEKSAQILNMIANDPKTRCYGEGNNRISTKTLKVLDGYENKVYINAKCNADKRIPQIALSNGTIVPANDIQQYREQAKKMYGGCRVNVVIKPWMQDNAEHGRGIRCELVALQFFKDDTPFGEMVDAAGMFAPVESPATDLSALFGQP